MNESGAVATPMPVEAGRLAGWPPLLANEDWLAAGVPSWLAEAASTEYYIKTGLVVLGCSIVFGDLFRAGLLGVTQAICVVTAVWFFCFWLARRLRVDDEFATMLAWAVPISGVSAAIATCGAIQGDRKKLSYVTSLVLIVAAPMMVLMPLVIKAFRMPSAGPGWAVPSTQAPPSSQPAR